MLSNNSSGASDKDSFLAIAYLTSFTDWNSSCCWTLFLFAVGAARELALDDALLDNVIDGGGLSSSESDQSSFFPAKYFY